MKRNSDTLISIEVTILATLMAEKLAGRSKMLVNELASQMALPARATTLVRNNTLARAVTRLDDRGFVKARWEPSRASGKRSRHTVSITAAGESALLKWLKSNNKGSLTLQMT